MTENTVPNRLKLPHFLPYRLATISNRISRTISRLYSDRYDLTIPEWRVMAVLGDESDLSASEVAHRTAMDKVAVSRAVSRLLAKKRLERHFSPQDRRRSVLALSPEGVRIHAKIMPLALSYEAELLSHLGKQETAELNRLLDRLEGLSLETFGDPARTSKDEDGAA
ncbi:MarR family transcriptional regulator [Iodidimonas muriae]|uniref:MarR family transcriptional regulator n=1 Tax=Iodidimonas muriae TaxID=261467 RepID=A0ABQ2LE31_9PROT|nr:MarR family winged helix-turn-helix transcriptional regulator [Iodidimonas muriae]GER07099.1 MarR family transcriptional regulator [Kordiimonadales bacterium JCM 17843]GGO13013.1 MarR family transcriptional regulator [Iodidimonas muriae]